MASFSIHDLLGLGKSDSRKTSDDSAGKSKSQTAEEDIDVETLHEDVYNAAHQLVTVEVRTVRHAASSLSRSSSRKRKRTEETKERESTPDSDGKAKQSCMHL